MFTRALQRQWTAFVATTSKTAVVALLLRYLPFSVLLQYRAVFLVLSFISIASMCVGNLLALRQSNVKRVLAYSSIAHFGYILVAFLAGTTMAAGAVAFYLVSYTVTILAAFGIVAVLSGSEGDATDLEDYRGLFWRRPVIASIFTAVLLSLAGIPATMGFIGKFYILASGANASAWLLIVVLVLTSVIGLFYYLRIVVTLFSRSAERQPSSQRLELGSTGRKENETQRRWYGRWSGREEQRTARRHRASAPAGTHARPSEMSHSRGLARALPARWCCGRPANAEWTTP